jgi:hypothetical protein
LKDNFLLSVRDGDDADGGMDSSPESEELSPLLLPRFFFRGMRVQLNCSVFIL